jgi:cephalosporin-C deacetylase
MGAGPARQSIMPFKHGYPFDPAYGLTLPDLLAIEPPPEPPGFVPFWGERCARARLVDPAPRLAHCGLHHPRLRVYDLEYRSTGGFPIRGWLVKPLFRRATRGFVLGHGYGGIETPSLDLPFEDAAYLVPCLRGLGRSRRPPISDDPAWHVLHDIQDRDRYILGGCVEDLWTGVSALLALFPGLEGHLGYLGISFGGGIGALALPWEDRIARGHLNVPSFGHWPLRLRLPTVGSGAAVQSFARRHVHVLETLAYYDAAVAARHIRQPMHLAAARFDPAVAPPGQFAIYNAIPGEKRLFVLAAGHFDHPGLQREEQALKEALKGFFEPL